MAIGSKDYFSRNIPAVAQISSGQETYVWLRGITVAGSSVQFYVTPVVPAGKVMYVWLYKITADVSAIQKYYFGNTAAGELFYHDYDLSDAVAFPTGAAWVISAGHFLDIAVVNNETVARNFKASLFATIMDAI